MTSRIPKLVLAAVLAGSVPAAASAHERDGRPGAYEPAPHHATPPRVDWREQRWREREHAAIHAELQRLEAERAQFHARYAGRPGKLRRYEREYRERRAELDRRMAQLHRVAWR